MFDAFFLAALILVGFLPKSNRIFKQDYSFSKSKEIMPQSTIFMYDLQSKLCLQAIMYVFIFLPNRQRQLLVNLIGSKHETCSIQIHEY